MSRFGLRSFVAIGISVWVATVACAEELPVEPLTLSAAMQWTAEHHSSIRNADLETAIAHIRHESDRAPHLPAVEVLVLPRRADRAAPAASDSLDDSRATLRIIQPVYDFGRAAAAAEVSFASLERAQLQQQLQLNRQLLETMRSYFDVLLADLDYAFRDEKMTLAFLRYNRMVEENAAYGAHAQVDVLAKETLYRELFVIREDARIQRTAARRNLALAMGASSLDGYVPRDLLEPDLSPIVDQTVPEFEGLMAHIVAESIEMAEARLNLGQSMSQLAAARSKFAPQLDAVLEGTQWAQDTGSRDAAMIGLRLNLPLASGTQKNRDVRIGQIKVEQAHLELADTEHSIREKAYDLWRQLRVLHLELAAAKVESDYRDHYMDRSRALYELEEAADLGDAQAEQLHAVYQMNRIRYQIALLWGEINLMTGLPVLEIHSNE